MHSDQKWGFGKDPHVLHSDGVNGKHVQDLEQDRICVSKADMNKPRGHARPASIMKGHMEIIALSTIQSRATRFYPTLILLHIC